MDKPLDRIEFETMLFARYSLASRKGEKYRLERSAYTLLYRLRMQGSMSIGELSDALGLDVSTLNRQTAALLRAELVKRIPDPDGGIARKFCITEEGRRQLESERAESLRHLETIMAEWSAGDVATFAAYLERFNVDIERYHGRQWPRIAASVIEQ